MGKRKKSKRKYKGPQPIQFPIDEKSKQRLFGWRYNSFIFANLIIFICVGYVAKYLVSNYYIEPKDYHFWMFWVIGQIGISGYFFSDWMLKYVQWQSKNEELYALLCIVSTSLIVLISQKIVLSEYSSVNVMSVIITLVISNIFHAFMVTKFQLSNRAFEKFRRSKYFPYIFQEVYKFISIVPFKNGIPWIVIIIVSYYILNLFLHPKAYLFFNEALENSGALTWKGLKNLEYWRLFTCTILNSNLGFLVLNVFVLGFVGAFENKQDKIRTFLIFFIGGSIGAFVSVFLDKDKIVNGSLSPMLALIGAFVHQTGYDSKGDWSIKNSILPLIFFGLVMLIGLFTYSIKQSSGVMDLVFMSGSFVSGFVISFLLSLFEQKVLVSLPIKKGKDERKNF